MYNEVNEDFAQVIPNFTRVDDGDDDDGAGPEISNLFISYVLTID